MAEKKRNRKTKVYNGVKYVQTKYGQKELRGSKKGLRSCAHAGLSGVILVWMIFASYISRGNVGILTGFMGVVPLTLSVSGIFLAIRGFKEREKSYVSCKAGIAFNGLILIFILAVFVKGVSLLW